MTWRFLNVRSRLDLQDPLREFLSALLLFDFSLVSRIFALSSASSFFSAFLSCSAFEDFQTGPLTGNLQLGRIGVEKSGGC